jgi:hypothetical protein
MSNHAKINADEIKGKINLFDLIGSHVQLSKNAIKDYHGQCPQCGSAHGLHVYERDGKQLFRCYGCGQMGDAIAYVMWVDNLSFIEACAELDSNLEAILALEPEKPISIQSASNDQPVGWDQDKAEKKLRKAQSDLHGNDASGRNYLLSRGLSPDTWKVFGLGYKADVYLPGTWDSNKKESSYPAQPAILIPWFRGGVLRGIRYRFLDKHTYTTGDGRESTNKIKSEYGSDFRFLYGSQSLTDGDKSDRTLVITEGEFNDMSVWQATHNSGVDTLSIGSETIEALTPSTVDAIRKWGKVIVFVDKETTAEEVSSRLPFATAISSEKGEDGGKCDANDMLVSGELAGFITAVRYDACQSDTEKGLLLTQLYSAYEAGDYDSYIVEFMQLIGNELCIDIFAGAHLDNQPVEHLDDSPVIDQPGEHDSTDQGTIDAADQAEQVVAAYDSLIAAIWQAYKLGATFRFGANDQLTVCGDIDAGLLFYLNVHIERNQSHFIATLHRMEHWRKLFVANRVYALDSSERAEFNHYAEQMGLKYSWRRVELSEAML